VAATFLGAEQVLVHFTMQDLLIDHPVGVGGTGAGPSPGELLLGALAACTSVYVGRNAQRYGVPVESVHVASRSRRPKSRPTGHSQQSRSSIGS